MAHPEICSQLWKVGSLLQYSILEQETRQHLLHVAVGLFGRFACQVPFAFVRHEQWSSRRTSRTDVAPYDAGEEVIPPHTTSSVQEPNTSIGGGHDHAQWSAVWTTF